MDEKRVIILCGGRGTRVQRYFPGVIKPLFIIQGIPIIQRIIAMFRDYTIFINCNEEDKSQLTYLHLPLLCERTRVGNAGALLEFQKELGNKFIVIHCDELTDLNPDDLWNSHDPDAVMTMVIKNIRKEKEFGLVIHDGERVSICTKDRFVNTGIYCCTNEIFKYIESNKIQDLDTDLFPKLIGEGYLYCYEHKSYWQDIGTSEFIKRVWYDGKKNKD